MLTTAALGRTFDYSYCLGTSAQLGGAGFDRPVDLAFGANNVIYVLNRGELTWYQRVTKMTTDHQFICDIGGTATEGPSEVFGRPLADTTGRFMWPTALALDSQENVYVSDDYYHRVIVFDSDGKFLQQWGTHGTGDGQLNAPAGLAFDQDENLYVVDAQNNRVQKYTSDGKFLAKWGRPGSGEGELRLPWGICLDSEGNVYVSDWGNGRVQKFSPSGQFLAMLGQAGSGAGELVRPAGIDVDSDGDIYVADWKADKVHVYASDGQFITALVGDAQQPSPWAQAFIDANPTTKQARRMVNLEVEWTFSDPAGVKVDSQGRIFVTEMARNRIQVYNKLPGFMEPSFTL